MAVGFEPTVGHRARTEGREQSQLQQQVVERSPLFTPELTTDFDSHGPKLALNVCRMSQLRSSRPLQPWERYFLRLELQGP
eukprot:4088813-Amphidinium_carterae.1